MPEVLDRPGIETLDVTAPFKGLDFPSNFFYAKKKGVMAPIVMLGVEIADMIVDVLPVFSTEQLAQQFIDEETETPKENEVEELSLEQARSLAKEIKTFDLDLLWLLEKDPDGDWVPSMYFWLK